MADSFQAFFYFAIDSKDFFCQEINLLSNVHSLFNCKDCHLSLIWPRVSIVKRKHIDPCLGQPAETELAVAVDRGEDDAGREEAGEDAGGGQEGVRGRGQEAAAAHVPGPEAAEVLEL